MPKNINISDEEYRDQESIRLILKKYNVFLKKLFNKYASAKVNKKDFFNEEKFDLNLEDFSFYLQHSYSVRCLIIYSRDQRSAVLGLE